jgi:phosphate transport system permease protein
LTKPIEVELPASILLVCLAAFGLTGWLMARTKARQLNTGRGALHSLPNYHGWHLALWILIPALLGWAIWSMISPDMIHRAVMASPDAANLPLNPMDRDSILSEAMEIAAHPGTPAFNPLAEKFVGVISTARAKFNWIGTAIVALLAFCGGAYGYTRIKAKFPARTRVEFAILAALLLASLLAIFTTVGIIASLLFETGRFFSMISPVDFLTGLHWNPQDGTGPEVSKSYGAVPLFWGTIFIGAIIAMVVAIPLGLMSAIYLTQYASAKVRKWVKPLLEILAGVPTVVYGYFAALTVAPLVRDLAVALGMENPSTESALAAGLVMGIMIIPFVSSMADDSIAAVPQAMRDGSLAMGATRSETIKRVLIPAALPGIVAGVMLAISRAIGETMIVVMAAGASANLSANPFASMTTVTYQIVQLLTGDQEFDSAKTLSAFALGLVLFIVTLVLNIIALNVVKRFREAYE